MLAVIALVWISLPVASGLFVGTLLAFSLEPVHQRLRRRGIRSSIAALLLAISSALVTVGGLLLLVYFIIVRGVVATHGLAQGLGPEGALRRLLSRLDEASRTLPFGPFDVSGRIRALASEAALKLTGAFTAVANATLSVLLMLFFTTMAAYFVLHNWSKFLKGAERMLPLHPSHTRVVFDEFQNVGKEVFVGTVLTGTIQGILAGLGYLIGGAPEVALLAVLTAVCSLLPAVGTLVVWVPVGVGLLLSGHTTAGIFVLVWGLLVVSIATDYVVRPKLVGKRGRVPALLTFIALFGGVETFGLMGLIVGPVVAAVSLAMLRTYDREISAIDAANLVTGEANMPSRKPPTSPKHERAPARSS